MRRLIGYGIKKSLYIKIAVIFITLGDENTIHTSHRILVSMHLNSNDECGMDV